jgi:hypothetical protein
MKGLLGRFAPTLAVCLVAAWCCWPHLAGKKARFLAGAGGELPEINDCLLTAEIRQNSGRDPFVPFQIEEQGSVDPTAPLVDYRDRIEPELSDESASREDLAKVVGSLTLNGTLIHGKLRVAVINGRSYEVGESVMRNKCTNAALVVAEIAQHSVLITSGTEVFQLTYGNPEGCQSQALDAPANPEVDQFTNGPTTRAITGVVKAFLKSGR